MSFTTWHNYGYALRTDNITIKSVKVLAELLRLAPEFEKEMQLYFEDCDIEEPEIDDYFEFQEYDNHGLASLMKMVLKETEQVEFTDCGDYDQYLISAIISMGALRKGFETNGRKTWANAKEIFFSYH